MSNANWVCFDCREALRRPVLHPGPVACPRCRAEMRCVGTKVAVPARGDDRGWRDLRVSVNDLRRAQVERRDRTRVRRRHALERRITELEARPENEGRARALRRLRDELATN